MKSRFSRTFSSRSTRHTPSAEVDPQPAHQSDAEHLVHDLTDYGLKVEEKIFIWLHRKVGQLSKTWVTHTLLMIAVIAYALIGALLFQLAEGNNKQIVQYDIFEARPTIIKSIMEETSKHTSLIDNREIEFFTGNITKSFQEYDKAVTKATNENVLMSRGKAELNWDYWPTVFFCCTIFSTIGYGHMFPVTDFGKILSVFYAMFGIPLFIIVLADFTRLLTRVLKFIWLNIRRIFLTGGCQKPEIDSQSSRITMGYDPDEYNILEEEGRPLSVTICMIFFAIYIFIGSFVYFVVEKWTFFEAFYFLFVSTTTLGLGDFVPQNQSAMMFTCVFMTFGLALSSMFVNEARKTFVEYMIKLSAKMRQRYGIDIEVDRDLVEDPGEKRRDSSESAESIH